MYLGPNPLARDLGARVVVTYDVSQAVCPQFRLRLLRLLPLNAPLLDTESGGYRLVS